MSEEFIHMAALVGCIFGFAAYTLIVIHISRDHKDCQK